MHISLAHAQHISDHAERYSEADLLKAKAELVEAIDALREEGSRAADPAKDHGEKLLAKIDAELSRRHEAGNAKLE